MGEPKFSQLAYPGLDSWYNDGRRKYPYLHNARRINAGRQLIREKATEVSNMVDIFEDRKPYLQHPRKGLSLSSTPRSITRAAKILSNGIKIFEQVHLAQKWVHDHGSEGGRRNVRIG